MVDKEKKREYNKKHREKLKQLKNKKEEIPEDNVKEIPDSVSPLPSEPEEINIDYDDYHKYLQWKEMELQVKRQTLDMVIKH